MTLEELKNKKFEGCHLEDDIYYQNDTISFSADDNVDNWFEITRPKNSIRGMTIYFLSIVEGCETTASYIITNEKELDEIITPIIKSWDEE